MDPTRQLGGLGLIVALAMTAGCVTERPAQTTDGGGAAVLQADPNAYVDSVDGAPALRGYQNQGFDLTPGSHTVRLRRRVEAPAGDKMGPADYPMRVGVNGLGEIAAYVSDAQCSITIESSPGAQYAARTAVPTAGADWVATISGPGVDASCTGHDAVPRDLAGEARYLCCTLSFDHHETTDANYRFEGSRAERLKAGTRVRVTAPGRNRVAFQVDGETATYHLYFEYGRRQADSHTYFHRIFVDEDPTAQLADAPPAIATAVAEGRLLVGMTKAQAIMARGYPPLHQTPDLEAPEWLYYNQPGEGDYVDFTGAVIKTIRAGLAP